MKKKNLFVKVLASVGIIMIIVLAIAPTVSYFESQNQINQIQTIEQELKVSSGNVLTGNILTGSVVNGSGNLTTK